jgi:hypothetical protein
MDRVEVETVCFMSCVGAKRTIPVPAKDLYRSDWFIKARGYVEAIDRPCFILSAKHGLITPDEVTPPYEQTLDTMGVSERRDWARIVQQQMDGQTPNTSQIVVLAGKRYREFFVGLPTTTSRHRGCLYGGSSDR